MATDLQLDTPDVALDGTRYNAGYSKLAIAAIAAASITVLLGLLAVLPIHLFGDTTQGRNWRNTGSGFWITIGVLLVGIIVSFVLISLARRQLNKVENLRVGGNKLVSIAAVMTVLVLVVFLVWLAAFLFTVPGNFFLPPWLA